jgi:protein-disulfide isomerase
MKNYIWMGSVVVVLVALMFFVVRNTKPSVVFEPGVINSYDNVEGNRDSKVVVTEYSDFECPACRAYYLVMRQMMAQFGDKVAFVYRHFPLPQHANAELAAYAAQAAGKQGKFWEMHNLLFEKQDEWSKAADVGPIFESYANLIGVSVEQFKIDWQSKEIKDLVKAEKDSAIKLNLPGTPSFFINGQQIKNPASVQEFTALINGVLKSQ